MAAITLTSGRDREEEVGGMEAQGSQLLVAVHTVAGGVSEDCISGLGFEGRRVGSPIVSLAGMDDLKNRSIQQDMSIAAWL